MAERRSSQTRTRRRTIPYPAGSRVAPKGIYLPSSAPRGYLQAGARGRMAKVISYRSLLDDFLCAEG